VLEIVVTTKTKPTEQHGMTLWRYLDLARLTHLLQTEELFFCRGDRFDDPLEGSYPLWATDIFAAEGSSYSAERWRKFVAVSCWHCSDFESDAMWRLYTDNKNGVAIKTTYQKLESAVRGHAYLKKVAYIDFLRDQNEAKIHIPSDVFEYKRKAFAHEHEVRAIHTHYPQLGIEKGVPRNSEPVPTQELPEDGVRVALCLKTLIDKIVVSPASRPWFFDVVRTLAAMYAFPGDIVVESELKLDPAYARISRG
jgi:Protein of unknown function (DUF2971)